MHFWCHFLVVNLLASSYIKSSLYICLISARKLLKFLFMHFMDNTCDSWKIIMRCHPLICSLCVILARALTNGIQQLVHSAFSIFPAEKRSVELRRSYTQNQVWNAHPREFPGYWWLFWADWDMALGCLKKEERKKKINNSDFRSFQVCHFKTVTTHRYYILLQTGAGSIRCSMYF